MRFQLLELFADIFFRLLERVEPLGGKACRAGVAFDHSAQLTLTVTFPCALSRFELNAIDLKISGGSDRVVR